MPYITHYESINSGCSSFILPLGCSGLTILSKHPIVEVTEAEKSSHKLWTFAKLGWWWFDWNDRMSQPAFLVAA